MDAKYIKAAFKFFLIIVVAGLIIQAVFFGAYWYKRKSFGKSGKYLEEKEYCEKVMKGEEGELTDYSYCKRYLDWLERNVSIDN